MLSGNEEYINAPSYENENDSLNTYFSNENYYTFNDKYHDLNFSEITGNISEYPTFHIEKPINPIFIVLSKRGRGKKPENGPNRHIHSNTHFDNLQIKIQVNYINFIINLSNDVLFLIFKNNKKYNIKDIDHAFKIDVSRQNFDFLKSSKIKDVLEKNISNKYKQFQTKYNKELLDEVCQKSPWLNGFFNLNYLDLFKYYYNDQKQIDKISFCDQIITLSKKTQKKTFYELLIKNKNISEELINAVKNVYFNGKDPNCLMLDENRIESK